MSSKTQAPENSVTRYDDPGEIACKLNFLAVSLNNLQYCQTQFDDNECAGLLFILEELADVVRTFKRGAA